MQADTDLKGEVGHTGYLEYLTFLCYIQREVGNVAGVLISIASWYTAYYHVYGEASELHES